MWKKVFIILAGMSVGISVALLLTWIIASVTLSGYIAGSGQCDRGLTKPAIWYPSVHWYCDN
jgi:hypothetical protein